MPIPTDTFWNIKRLNWWFAVSAVLLTAVTAWSIMQDHEKSWRIQQRQGRLWEAALTSDKIDALQNNQQRLEQIKQLDAQIAAADKELEPQRQQVRQLEAQVKKLTSDRLTLEFDLNNKKSSLTVMESALQDAMAANDAALVKKLTADIQAPRKKVAQDTEFLANKVVAPLEEAQQKLRDANAKKDELEGRKKKLHTAVESSRKKVESLQPKSFIAKISEEMRNAPLLDFVNPSEKVQQLVLPDVLTDVAFMKITTLDRCQTCHVNIGNKDFTVEKIVAYLEEQSAKANGFVLPETPSTKTTGPAASAAKPGAVAMPQFWHAWAARVSPDTVKKQAGRINQITAVVGKGVTIELDGKPLTTFKYNPALNDPKAPPSTAPSTAPSIDGPTQNTVLIALIDSLYHFNPAKAEAVSVSRGNARVAIVAGADKTALTNARDVAMRYVEELYKGLATTLPAEQLRLINDRYRYAMVDAVNPVRKKEGLPALDASPALLAHSRLDLYVSADSYHPADLAEKRLGVGCTSCHDGSGQETDFVVAAHVPREIMVDRDTGVPVPDVLLPAKPSEEEIDNATMSSMLTAVAPEEEIVPKGVASLHIELGEHKTHGHDAHGEDPKPVAYVDPVSGKSRQAVTQMTYWKAKYEPEAPRNFALVYHEWDWPMRPPELLQANCARCHSSILDIKDEAPTLFQGRELFASLGCVNCHIMNSVPAESMPKDATHLDAGLVMSNNRVKVGPSLINVTSKLSREFINTWIWAPKAFRPSTKMPHFFMLENNSSDEELRRTRQEARAITEYISQVAEPLAPAHPMAPGLHGSADAGKIVFNSIGCQACHVNLNDPQAEKRNNKPITLGEKWIVNDLVKGRSLKKEEAEKLYDGMTYNERQVYVKEKFEQEPGQPREEFEKTWKYTDGSPKPIFVHVGPELSGLGTKLLDHRKPEEARQWLFDWIKEPRHYSPYTIMPRLRLSDQQAIDVAEYLLAQTRKSNKEDDPWTAGLCEVDTQKQIELTSLFLRSKYSAMTALAKADDDKELTAMAVDALKRVTNTPEEDKAATAEAEARVAKLDKDTKRMVWLGKKLIGNYGCMSCHAINGTQKITSPCADLSDWGQKGVDKLGYDYLDPHKLSSLPLEKPLQMVNGLCAESSKIAHDKFDPNKPVAAPVHAGWPVIEHLRTDWLQHKLKNTRIYDRGKELLEPNPKADDTLVKLGKPYDKLKMPTFYLNDTQVHQIVTFVISNRDKLISDKLAYRANNAEAKAIARGRELTHKFNCVSCHWIENNQPQIQQYYKQDEMLEKAPPPIRGEGNKVQFSWLFNFFKNVIDLRPLLYQHNGIRMPSFPATDDEWTAIIDYFNAISTRESKHLAATLAGVNKYIEDEKKKAGKLPPPEKAWPGDDWYTRDEFAQARQALYDWSMMSRNMVPLQFDPTKNSPEELGKSYRQALFKAQFTIDLYNSPYPFVESGAPAEIADSRYKLGEELFMQMQCLSCHYLGDPNAPGAVKEPKAPNLSLAHDRLQRRWVRHWVQEPPVIQPGTKMPAFLSGLPVFNLHGQSWSEATGRPKEEIEFFGNRYGKTADEQADLVLDYLYAAGERGVTSVQTPLDQLPHPQSATTQPAAPATAPAAAPSTPPATAPSQ